MATSSRAPEPRRFTREEYDRMHDAGLFRDERVELLDGAIIAMGANNPPHASTVGRLTSLLVPMLVGRSTTRVQLPSDSIRTASRSRISRSARSIPTTTRAATRHPSRSCS